MIEGGYYVEPPGRTVAHDLGPRLELEPTSSHIVLGGVGSGKTTQLMVMCDRLNRVDDILALFIDVTEHCDPHQLQTDRLDAVVAKQLLDHYVANGRDTDESDREFIEYARNAVDQFQQLTGLGWKDTYHTAMREEVWSVVKSLRSKLSLQKKTPCVGNRLARPYHRP